jgi:hypothetical protein
MKNDYYVYLYLRAYDSKHAPRFTPYYVGKGRKNRAFSCSRTIPRPQDSSLIVFVREQMTEAEAFALEKYCIGLYGRIDNGTGILRNLTDGGEGSSGFKHSPETCAQLSEMRKGTRLSEEHRKKIATLHRGRKRSAETRRKISESQKGKIIPKHAREHLSRLMKGRKLSPEHRSNIAEAGKGRKASDETKEKLSRAKAKYIYELTAPDGTIIVTHSLQPVADQHGLTKRALYSVAVGDRDHHKGWKVKILEQLR